jgi:hypothetical protein
VSRKRFCVGKMRKRTYTALEETGNWGTNLQDVLQSQKKPHVNQKKNERNISTMTPLSVLDENVSSIGNTQPDSLSGLKTSKIKDSTTEEQEEEEEEEEDSIPLTTIHNLVGTCEIFSSVQPIDLEYVFRCLPNSYYNRQRFAAITIRVTEPVCTGLLFTSGKLVITGEYHLHNP